MLIRIVEYIKTFGEEQRRFNVYNHSIKSREEACVFPATLAILTEDTANWKCCSEGIRIDSQFYCRSAAE